ncbi:MAG: hypothetical protein JWR69_2613 [Pedosphaera sp.]|nr:hypothetical protein [Pedosphaera sp.]
MRFCTPLILLMTAALISSCATPPPAAVQQRTSFIALKDVTSFTRTLGAAPGEVVLTSPEIAPPIDWNELVASWNLTAGAYLKIEARAIYPDRATDFYTLSQWSENPALHPRASVNRQRNADGTVKIDTLVMTRPGAKVQLRLTLGNSAEATPAQIKFLGLSFCDSRVEPAPAKPNRAAWGKALAVPERRQAEYEGGGGWCSPTSLSMVLAYWSEKLNRPELNHTVPDVAAAINDTGLDGTGNWPFNTAYAGAFPGMRGYVTRLNDVSELEDWIAAGIPVIVSVSSYLTNDRHSGPNNGHLIVCAGFTEQGDFVANDPGVSVKKKQSARRTYPRERFAEAWKNSKNAVYLIYPETASIPKNRSGNWESR